MPGFPVSGEGLNPARKVAEARVDGLAGGRRYARPMKRRWLHVLGLYVLGAPGLAALLSTVPLPVQAAKPQAAKPNKEPAPQSAAERIVRIEAKRRLSGHECGAANVWNERAPGPGGEPSGKEAARDAFLPPAIA